MRKIKTDLTRNPIEGFSAGLVDDSNVLQWQSNHHGPSGYVIRGRFLHGDDDVPERLPEQTAGRKFKSEIWHRTCRTGRVCISILHDAGDDPMGYECASERWSPVQTVETIMLSIISMLSSPGTDESPANIDAAKMFREDYAGFKKTGGEMREGRVKRSAFEMRREAHAMKDGIKRERERERGEEGITQKCFKVL